MKPRAMRTLIASLKEMGLSPGEERLSQFKLYVDILQQWNKRMNLVGNASDVEIVHKHIIDSLMPAVQHPEGFTLENKNLLDAGSGAGLPGLVLRIMFPSIRLVLVESRQKKCQFLQHTVTELGLSDVEILAERLETLAHQTEYREQFDVVVARALGKLPVVAELCLPFVKKDGFFVAYKSGNYQVELDNAEPVIRLLGGELVATKQYTLPRTEIGRVLLFIQKISPTPSGYPRRAGIPQKRPIKIKQSHSCS